MEKSINANKNPFCRWIPLTNHIITWIWICMLCISVYFVQFIDSLGLTSHTVNSSPVQYGGELTDKKVKLVLYLVLSG